MVFEVDDEDLEGQLDFELGRRVWRMLETRLCDLGNLLDFDISS